MWRITRFRKKVAYNSGPTFCDLEFESDLMSCVEAFSLEVPPSIERERVVRALRSSPEPVLVLDTCQRLEVFAEQSFDVSSLPVSQRWRNAVAFERLARIAAGLESRILGELEVLGQVREAYKEFRNQADAGHLALDRIFQDALALGRKARKQSGIDAQMISLSGLASREMLRLSAPGLPMAVIGSGSLAGSIARYLGKRGTSPIRVSSRCPDNATSLADSVGGFGSGLEDLQHLLDGVAGIICATAAPHPVIYPQHIEHAVFPLHIIDLGVPPDCCDEVRTANQIKYTGLEDIEARAEGNVEKRRRRAESAAAIIRDGALAWSRKQ